MKRKTFGILVCMLLITVTISPVAGIINKDDDLIKMQLSLESESHFTPNSIEDDEWPKFRRDLNNTGFSTSIAPQTNTIKWTSSLPDAAGISPAVVDGRVFLGSNNFGFHCLDADNGKRLWDFYIDGGVPMAIAVFEDNVYVPTNYGQMYCFDVVDGSIQWCFNLSDSGGSPSVADGKVYFGEKKYVWCLNADNGEVIWNYLTGDTVKSAPAIVNDKVYIGSCDSKLYCLDAETGEKLWDFNTGWMVISSPAVFDGLVYTGGGGLYCLDAETGEQIWEFNGITLSSPGIAYGKVYNIAINGGWITCHDAYNGSVIWKTRFSSYEWDGSSAAIADGKIYIGIWSSGDLVCLDAFTGELIWKYPIAVPEWLFYSPAVAYGRVYIGGGLTNKIYCFEDPSLPPEAPTVDGPTSGILNQRIGFTIKAIDPEGSDIEYYIEWGDGSHTGWIGPYTSGKETRITKSWHELGTYNIQVKARDGDGLESKWSEPHTITVIAAPALKIRTISGGLFNVKSVIENYGSLEATDVNWNIAIDGGFILFGRGSSGVVTSIPVGEKRTINSGFIFGFGDVVVAVSAMVSDGLSDSREWMGSVFLFFIKIKYSSSL